MSKLLLRHGIVYSGGKAWTGSTTGGCASSASTIAPTQSPSTPPTRPWCDRARRDRLDKAITELAADSEFTPLVRRLACLRGIATLTGFALAVEIGDWDRFTGGSIGAYLGLVPSEHSSGAPGAGLDHQDRQHPRPPAAGRGRLAPPQQPYRPAVDAAAPLGPGRPAAGRAGMPATSACTTLGRLNLRKKRAGHRQRRDRPRTGRLVLVAGRARPDHTP